MKTHFIAVILGALFLHTSSAQTTSTASMGSIAPSIPAAADTAQAIEPAEPAYQLVEGLIKDPRLLEKAWPEMRKAFPIGCNKSDDSPDVICPSINGVIRLSAITSGTGIVDAVFSNPISCDGLYEVISKRFGPGEIENGNKCASTWKLNAWVKRGHVRVSRGKKDPSKIFFQMAIEQGP